MSVHAFVQWKGSHWDANFTSFQIFFKRRPNVDNVTKTKKRKKKKTVYQVIGNEMHSQALSTVSAYILSYSNHSNHLRLLWNWIFFWKYNKNSFSQQKIQKFWAKKFCCVWKAKWFRQSARTKQTYWWHRFGDYLLHIPSIHKCVDKYLFRQHEVCTAIASWLWQPERLLVIVTTLT